MSQRVERVIEKFDVLADWTVLGNDTDNLELTVRSAVGTNALEFDKVDGAANTKLAGAYKTLNSENLEDTSPSDYWVWHVYVSSLTNVDYAFMRIGTSASHYVEYQFPVAKMTAGIFTRCHAQRAQFTSQTGNGATWSDVDYLVVGVAFAAENNTLANIAVDELCLFPALAPTLEADLALEVQAVANEAATSEVSQVAGIANAAAPSYDEGDAAALSTDLSGGLRTSLDLAQGVPDAAAPTEAVQVGAVANAAAPTPDEGDMGALSMNLTSELRVRADTAQAAHDAAAPAEAIAAGARANATADTPDEGDIAQLSVDLNSNLRTRVDQAQAATGAAAPAQAVQAGILARSTFPAAVDNGDTVAPLGDLYGRAKLAAHVESSAALATQDVGASPRQKYGPETLTALTAAGSTAARGCHGCGSIKWSFVVASLEAGQFCVVRAEAREDGTNWNNMSALNQDVTITANGNYQLYASNRTDYQTRFTLVTDSVGGAVTITPTLTMAR